MMTEFKKDKIYNFQTYAPARLGSSHKGMYLSSNLGFNEAIRLVPNLIETWKIVYPSLPPGIVNDPKLSNYYFFTGPSENTVCLADVWINPATVTEVSRQVHKYTISDIGLTQTDIQKVMRILSQAGYNNITFEVKHY